MRARRREFTQQAEAEVESLLATQPDWQSLYLPTPLPPPPLPSITAPLPPHKVEINRQNLHTEHEDRFRQTERTRQEFLRQLAQEWAQSEGYRLTEDPNAPDRTDAFLVYLHTR